MSERDEFPEKVRRVVAERSGYFCANPVCRKPTVFPHTDASKSLKTGVVAHIRAAAEGGPRYDPTQSAEQRRAISNAIWLCHVCSDLIDGDVARFPAGVLEAWRTQHEAWVGSEG